MLTARFLSGSAHKRSRFSQGFPFGSMSSTSRKVQGANHGSHLPGLHLVDSQGTLPCWLGTFCIVVNTYISGKLSKFKFQNFLQALPIWVGGSTESSLVFTCGLVFSVESQSPQELLSESRNYQQSVQEGGICG